ncbi:MAG: tautomerase family protein, partial [Cyanobacteria bacterium P01_D01_bin.123]
KIYGLRSPLDSHRDALSEAIHAALQSAFGTPENKRFQRFIALEPEDFIFPGDRSSNYTIIEILAFEGRSDEAKRSLIRDLFANIEAATCITSQDIEIVLIETPASNWGIRGQLGSELTLSYSTNI